MHDDIITVGIVEDETIEREAMALFINQNFGFLRLAWQAADGKSGLEAWQKHPVDILIVDIRMPIMDGLTLCERLSQTGCESVIVINTAFDSFEYARRAVAFHAFDYLLKPVDNDDLLETLGSCIAEARQRTKRKKYMDEHAMLSRSLGRLGVEQLTLGAAGAGDPLTYLEPLGWARQGGYQTYVIHCFSAEALNTESMKALETELELFSRAGWLTASDFVTEHHMIALADPQSACEPQKCYTLLWIYGKYLAHHENLSVYIGTECSDIRAVAQECACSAPLATAGGLNIPNRHWKHLRSAEAEKLKNTLQRLLTDGQFTTASRLLDEARQGSSESSLEWELAQWLFAAVMDVWPEKRLLTETSMGQLFGEADDPCGIVMRAAREQPPLEQGDVISRALYIMKTEFGGSLSQSELSNRLGLEQCYFSRLF